MMDTVLNRSLSVIGFICVIWISLTGNDECMHLKQMKNTNLCKSMGFITKIKYYSKCWSTKDFFILLFFWRGVCFAFLAQGKDAMTQLLKCFFFLALTRMLNGCIRNPSIQINNMPILSILDG